MTLQIQPKIRKKPEYFPRDSAGPPPLTIETAGKVRFEEVDALGVVWHGRYSSYFELGRCAFGDCYDLAYLEMHKDGFTAPVVQMHIDYHNPLRFPDEFAIRTSLIWSPSCRVNFEYEITSPGDHLIATGYTVQLLVDANQDVLLLRPRRLEKFWENWKETTKR